MSAAERGIVKDVIFRGNHLDVVVDVGGIPIVTERSLEKDPVEIGEQVYVLIYRPAIYSELVLTCKLHTVLADLNEQAMERCDLITRQMAQAEGVSE